MISTQPAFSTIAFSALSSLLPQQPEYPACLLDVAKIIKENILSPLPLFMIPLWQIKSWFVQKCRKNFALQIGLLLALLGYKVLSERERVHGLFLIFWPQQISKEEEVVWKYL